MCFYVIMCIFFGGWSSVYLNPCLCFSLYIIFFKVKATNKISNNFFKTFFMSFLQCFRQLSNQVSKDLCYSISGKYSLKCITIFS